MIIQMHSMIFFFFQMCNFFEVRVYIDGKMKEDECLHDHTCLIFLLKNIEEYDKKLRKK